MSLFRAHSTIMANTMAFVTVLTLIISLFPASAFAVQVVESTPECAQGRGENLLANGSFETPVLVSESDGWDIFDSVINGLVWSVSWVNPTEGAPSVAKLELQDGLYTASAGAQYAELDSNWTNAPGAVFNGEDARVKIEQTIPTVVGSTYTLKYDFSPLPHTNAANNLLKVYVNGDEVNSLTADGSAASSTSWSTHNLTFIASTTETTIAFADNGVADTFGTLLDNVSLTTCITGGNGNGGGDADEDNGGGSSSGRHHNSSGSHSSSLAGQVFGAATSSVPVGEVLGAATTTLPVGAPNTGAGGTSPLVINFGFSPIILGARMTVRKATK